MSRSPSDVLICGHDILIGAPIQSADGSTFKPSPRWVAARRDRAIRSGESATRDWSDDAISVRAIEVFSQAMGLSTSDSSFFIAARVGTSTRLLTVAVNSAYFV